MNEGKKIDRQSNVEIRNRDKLPWRCRNGQT